MATLINIFNKNTLNSKETITFITARGEYVLTYSEFNRKVKTYAEFLKNNGVGIGMPLVIQTMDTYDFITAFWSGLSVGAIPVPFPISLDIKTHLEKLHELANQFDKMTILFGNDLALILKKYGYNSEQLITKSNVNFMLIDATQIEAKEIEVINEPSISLSDVALIQYSSGSTGVPKGVELTHSSILEDLESTIRFIKLTPQDKFSSWLPLTHDFGLLLMHICPLIGGISQILMDTALFFKEPLKWFEIISKKEVTVSAMPVFAMKLFATINNSNIVNKDINLQNLRIMTTGGEMVSKSLCDIFNKFLCAHGAKSNTIMPAYGLAEACVSVCSIPVETNYKFIKINRNRLLINEEIEFVDNNKNALELISNGIPIDCNSIRIINNENQILPEKYVGKIEIFGKNLMKGYYNNPELTNTMFTEDGWLKTGDTGVIVNEEIYIIGREKDVVIKNGQNYYVNDIIDVVMQNPLFNKIIFTLIENQDTSLKTEEIYLIIEDSDLINEELESNLFNYVTSCFGLMCDDIYIVDNLPKTSIGKIRREVVKNEILNTTFSYKRKSSKIKKSDELAKLSKKNKIIEMLIQALSNHLGSELSIDDINMTFAEIGLDSVKAQTISSTFIEKIGDTFTIDLFWNYPSIEKLADFFSNQETFII